MTEDEFADLARREQIVVVVDHAELYLADRLTHRPDAVNVVHKETGRIDHSINFDDFDAETILEFLPHRWRTCCREHHPHFVLAIVGTRRLLEQNRNHAAQGVELDGVVLAAFVPESRGAEALGDREFGIQKHRAESRDHQRVAVKRGERGVDGLAGAQLDRAQHRSERSATPAAGDDAFRRPGGARGVHQVCATGDEPTSTSGSRSGCAIRASRVVSTPLPVLPSATTVAFKLGSESFTAITESRSSSSKITAAESESAST